jgi:hypothetical protein
MDSFKQRLNILEQKTKALELNLCMSHETENEIHIQDINKEMGVIPLNEFDTFRFVRAENWLMPEFTKTDGAWKHGIVSNAPLYFLTNPTKEIKELVDLTVGQKVDFTTHTICFKYHGEKTSFEAILTDKKLTEFYLFWYQGGPCYGKLSILQPLYKILDSKPFEIEEFPKQKLSKNPPYDFILSDFIHGMNYKANLTIDFKNNYGLLPHVSYFFTPLDIKTLKVTLKSLTTKQAIFELKYGTELVDTSTQFHWMVSGLVV